MKTLFLALFLTACAAPPTVNPIIGIWTVTHNADTWTWTLDEDGKLWEPGGCGEWYYAGKDLIITSGYLRTTLRGRIVQADGGMDYLVWGEVYFFRK